MLHRLRYIRSEDEVIIITRVKIGEIDSTISPNTSRRTSQTNGLDALNTMSTPLSQTPSLQTLSYAIV